MKQILLALAITAFACSGVQAQTGCKTTGSKHLATKRVQKQKTTTEVCRLLPYEVCTINPDRKSVSCFKTTDPQAIEPMNNKTIVYGSEGKLPGQVEKPKIRTIVIKGEGLGNYCIRDYDGKATICYEEGGRLTRDENGFYHYR